MADITQIFKSTVKMLKVRQKSVSSINKGEGGGDDSKLLMKQQSSSLTQSGNSKSGSKLSLKDDEQFTAKAKQIIRTVSKLREFLLRHRRSYLAASSHMPLENGEIHMTDSERDKIDEDAMNYMKLCKETLRNTKTEALHKHLTSQHREHRTAVFTLIEEYLRVVCLIYSEQRAIRVKRAVENTKLTRLELKKDVYKKPGIITEESASEKPTNTAKKQIFDDDQSAQDVEVTQEEAQMFKEENEQLYDQLNSTMNEVKQIEGKVVEITKLQEIFTEKVLEQEKDLENIGENLITTSENVVAGNQEIREAMKNNAGMRVWIIFGICVLAFTLLFLDWYND